MSLNFISLNLGTFIDDTNWVTTLLIAEDCKIFQDNLASDKFIKWLNS